MTTTVAMSLAQIETLIKTTNEAALAASVVFNQNGNVYVSIPNKNDETAQGFILDVFEGRATFVRPESLKGWGFTQPIKLKELRQAALVGGVEDAIVVNHAVYHGDSQIKTIYPLTFREWKQWNNIGERCSTYSEEAHRDHYRISVEEFLNRYEVRNGCWEPRPTFTDKKVSKYVGAAILAGIAAGVVIPNTILAGIGGLFVGAALYKRNLEKDQSKK